MPDRISEIRARMEEVVPSSYGREKWMIDDIAYLLTALTEVRRQVERQARTIRRLNQAREHEGPSAIDMVAALDLALHGATWARPQTPEQVWTSLLDEVMELRK